jgi:putative transposase
MPERERDHRRLRERLRALAGERRRFGYRRLHELLRREGWQVNHKLVERLYAEEKLAVRRRGRQKRGLGGVLAGAWCPIAANQRWSWTSPRTAWPTAALPHRQPEGRLHARVPGHPGRLLAAGQRVVACSRMSPESAATPDVLVVDNGPELRGRDLDRWAHERGVRLFFIDPGKPMQNASIESFNGRFREECLDQSWFTSLSEARRVIEAWRVDYNEHRPHTSLRMRTPAAFAAARPFAKPRRPQPAPDATSPDVVAALTAPVLSSGSGFP